jgi:hypothetical protein
VSTALERDLERIQLIKRLMEGHRAQIDRHMACALELERETERLLRAWGIEPRKPSGSTEGAAG